MPNTISNIPASRINTPGYVSAFKVGSNGLPVDGMPDLGYTPRSNPNPITPPTPTLPSNYASRINSKPTFEESEKTRSDLIATESERARAAKVAEGEAVANAIRASFAPLFNQQNQQNDRNNARTRAINVSSGLAGSDFASTRAVETEERGKSAIRELNTEMEAKIAEVLSRATSNADEAAATKRKEINESMDAVIARRKTYQDENRAMITTLATAGTDLTKLKEVEPDAYNNLLTRSGFNSPLEFDAYFNSQKPKAQKIDYQYETIESDGKKYIFAYGIDPITGKMVTQKYDAGTTKGQKPIIVDGVPYYQDPNDPMKLIKAGGFQPKPEKPKEATQTEKNTYNRTKVIELAQAEFNKSRGGDGYINPTLYMEARTDWAKKIGSVNEFDRIFSNYLSEDSRQKIGVGKTSSSNDDDM